MPRACWAVSHPRRFCGHAEGAEEGSEPAQCRSAGRVRLHTGTAAAAHRSGPPLPQLVHVECLVVEDTLEEPGVGWVVSFDGHAEAGMRCLYQVGLIFTSVVHDLRSTHADVGAAARMQREQPTLCSDLQLHSNLVFHFNHTAYKQDFPFTFIPVP